MNGHANFPHYGTKSAHVTVLKREFLKVRLMHDENVIAGLIDYGAHATGGSNTYSSASYILWTPIITN
jgi:hypothetical protein